MLKKAFLRPSVLHLSEINSLLSNWKINQSADIAYSFFFTILLFVYFLIYYFFNSIGFVSNVSLSDVQKSMAMQEIAASSEYETNKRLVACLIMCAINLMIEKNVGQRNIQRSKSLDNLYQMAEEYSNRGDNLAVAVLCLYAILNKSYTASYSTEHLVRILYDNTIELTEIQDLKDIITKLFKTILSKFCPHQNEQHIDLLKVSY